MAVPGARNTLVLPINKRDRIPQAAIDDVVRQIVDKFKPIKIILFGSYAYGKPTPISDVDLLVVIDSPVRERELSISIRRAIEYHFGLDLLVKTPMLLSRRIEMGDFFLKEILQRGRILYERNTR